MFIVVKIAIVVSVSWRQSYQIKSEKNALGKNVLSKGTQRKSFTQIGPRSSEQYNFQNVHLLFKHPVGGASNVNVTLISLVK